MTSPSFSWWPTFSLRFWLTQRGAEYRAWHRGRLGAWKSWWRWPWLTFHGWLNSPLSIMVQRHSLLSPWRWSPATRRYPWQRAEPWTLQYLQRDRQGYLRGSTQNQKILAWLSLFLWWLTSHLCRPHWQVLDLDNRTSRLLSDYYSRFIMQWEIHSSKAKWHKWRALNNYHMFTDM